MIEAAERAGHLKPGHDRRADLWQHGARARDRRRVRGISSRDADKMSQEKISLLRAYGAEVVICPTAVPPESPGPTASPTASPRRSPARTSRTSTSTPRTRPRTTRPPAPRSGARPTGRSTSWWRASERAARSRGRPVPEGTQTGSARGRGRSRGSIYSGDVHPYLTGHRRDFWPTTFDPSLVDRYVRVSDRDAFRMARRITRGGGDPGGLVLRDGGRCGADARRRAPGGDHGGRDPARHRSQLPLQGVLGHMAAAVRPDGTPRDRARRGDPVLQARARPAAHHGQRSRQGPPGDRRPARVQHLAGPRGPRGRRRRRAVRRRRARERAPGPHLPRPRCPAGRCRGGHGPADRPGRVRRADRARVRDAPARSASWSRRRGRSSAS